MSAGLLRRSVVVASGWGPEERDAVLYSASALFAICTAQLSSISLYQQWGRLAVGPYAFGAVASAWAARRARKGSSDRGGSGSDVPGSADRAGSGSDVPGSGGGPWHWNIQRTVIFLIVLLGATLVPLSLEVMWQADTGGTVHAQPEVAVVERAGDRVAHLQDPYQLVDGGRHKVAPPSGEPAYDAYNPYLPLMSAFGLAHSTKAPPRLTDARVAFSFITILLVIAALALCRGPTGPRVLTLQAMTVLPTAALPLATGGDDVPVAAIMLLGLVFLQRRRPLAAGVALGIAASMKITAWPLAAIAFLAARDREGRSGRRPAMLVVAGMAGVMIPSILPSALANVPAFVDNVVRFPLGLAGISSPAASPLLGHVVVSWFPGIHRLFTVGAVLAGCAVLGYVLVKHTPRSPAQVARLLGWVMTIGILLAPATRIGYLLYPVDFFIWAWLLRSEEGADVFGDVASPSVLVGAGVSPAGGDGGSGGVVHGEEP
ncbi:MAG TPA: glycosyltransferase family 87 protein [Acidimicrobiales bacterium]|nr:glycosyltransferase family 87 protein [Acidimicrobiales bacterium]